MLDFVSLSIPVVAYAPSAVPWGAVNFTLPPLPEVKEPPLVEISALMMTAPTPSPSVSEFSFTFSLPPLSSAAISLLMVIFRWASRVRVASPSPSTFGLMAEFTVMLAAWLVEAAWMVTSVPLFKIPVIKSVLIQEVEL